MTNRRLFDAFTWAKLSIEVTTNNLHTLVFAGRRSYRLVCLFDLVVRVATVWHVCTYQDDRLFVDRN